MGPIILAFIVGAMSGALAIGIVSNRNVLWYVQKNYELQSSLSYYKKEHSDAYNKGYNMGMDVAAEQYRQHQE